MGKPREHVPIDELFKGLAQLLGSEKRPEGFEMDEVDVCIILGTVGWENVEEVYKASCVLAAKNVERWWHEIDALAARLKEDVYLDGAEAVEVIRSASSEEK